MWLMIYKRLPFELVLINPGSKGSSGSRHPDYLAKNPAGTIPTFEEPDTGFALGEAHAIMTYLCDKHAWHDVYPADLQQRARVDWYLNYHHRNVREASIGLVAPRIRKDLDIPTVIQEAARRNFTHALRLFDTRSLTEHRFVAGDNLTIADFAAYVEIGQTRAAFTNVFDFTEFPNVARWLDDMSRVAGHDEVPRRARRARRYLARAAVDGGDQVRQQAGGRCLAGVHSLLEATTFMTDLYTASTPNGWKASAKSHGQSYQTSGRIRCCNKQLFQLL